MQICPECNTENLDDAVFCVNPKCRTFLQWTKPPAGSEETGAPRESEGEAVPDAAATPVLTSPMDRDAALETPGLERADESEDPGAAEIPAPEIPSAEIPSAEIPSAEIPSAEIPSAEIPSAETASFAAVKPGTKRPSTPEPSLEEDFGEYEGYETAQSRAERARFLAVRPGESRAPSAPFAPRPEPPRAGVTISLTPTECSVDPGAEVACEILVRNTGTVVDQFTIQVSGEAARWAMVEPPALNLYPGSDPGVATVRFSPPHSPFTPPGPARFDLRAVSREDSNVSAVARGTLNVASFYNLSSELVPQTSQGRRKAEHRLTVTNQSNASLRVALTASDPDNLLGIQLDPSSLVVGPGREAGAVVRVRPKKLYWLGTTLNRPFQLTGVAEGAPPLQAHGQFQHIPLLPRWVPKAAIIALPLLVALIVYLVRTAELPKVTSADSVSEASEKFRREDFTKVTLAPPVESDTVPKGNVIGIEPADDGRRKLKTTPIKIVPSAGLRVPEVLGRDQVTATSLLEDKGLKVRDALLQPSKEAAGKVIATDPPANTLVSRGEEVTLRISSGIATLLPNPTSVTMPAQPVGTSSPPQAVTINNQGTGNLTVGASAIGGANAGDFALAGDSCQGAIVPPGGSCAIQIVFTPTGAGARTGALTVTSDSPGGTPPVALSGAGLVSEIGLGAANLAFENQKVNTPSPAQTVTVTNKGSAPMRMEEATLAGDNASDFTLTDGCKGNVVAPGSACTISVVFTPQAKGARSGKLNITNDAGGLQSVALSGGGTVPVARVDKPFIRIETNQGTSEVTIINAGEASMRIGLPTLEGANSRHFMVLVNECRGELASNGSCKVTVRWSPPAEAAAGCSRAILTVSTDDADVPVLRVDLVGTTLGPPPNCPNSVPPGG